MSICLILCSFSRIMPQLLRGVGYFSSKEIGKLQSYLKQHLKLEIVKNFTFRVKRFKMTVTQVLVSVFSYIS